MSLFHHQTECTLARGGGDNLASLESHVQTSSLSDGLDELGQEWNQRLAAGRHIFAL